jgi:hypothetical protein
MRIIKLNASDHVYYLHVVMQNCNYRLHWDKAVITARMFIKPDTSVFSLIRKQRREHDYICNLIKQHCSKFACGKDIMCI